MSDMTSGEYAARLERAAVATVNRQAVYAQQVAVPLTPIEYGDLRDSEQVVPAAPGQLEAALVSNLEYSIYVHEDLDAQHTEGGPKFFEKAATRTQKVAEQIGAQAMREVFG